MPTALVTGGTGLLGSHIAERLVRDGWRVRALVRDPGSRPARWLKALGAEPSAGNVQQRDGFIAAATGCDAVFHAAAEVMPRGGWEAFRGPNIDGTSNAIIAAERSGARLVHVSSVAVYGAERRYHGTQKIDESVALRPLPDDQHYARSKRESEDLVLGAHGAGRIWATALRPCVIYGPRDRQFIPSLARLFSRGVAPMIGGGRTTLSLVHAANVADAAVRAAAVTTAGGHAYNVANDFDVTFSEFVSYAAEGLERRVLKVPVPLFAASAGMAVLRPVLRILKGDGAATMAGSSLSFLTRDNPFTSARARRELGWSPVIAHADGVREAFRWWKTSR